jgi:hypothetical protein
MEITLSSTNEIKTVGGMQGRIWEGKTAAGTPILAWIARIAVKFDQDQTEFEKELESASSFIDATDGISLRLLI